MNKLKLLTLVATLFLGNSSFAQDAAPTPAAQPAQAAAAFTLESSTFRDGEFLPIKTAFDKFGCGGQNILPHLKWSNVPAGTKSFVITEYDPDAPTVSGFWHWGIYNISSLVNEIDEGANLSSKLPAGASEMFTDYGSVGYGGSCPPVGDKAHRYIYTIYALNVEKLELNPATTTGAFLMFNLRDKTLGSAKLTGLYQRSAGQ